MGVADAAKLADAVPDSDGTATAEKLALAIPVSESVAVALNEHDAVPDIGPALATGLGPSSRDASVWAKSG